VRHISSREDGYYTWYGLGRDSVYVDAGMRVLAPQHFGVQLPWHVQVAGELQTSCDLLDSIIARNGLTDDRIHVNTS
jgi:hypothetical protein